MAHLLEDASNQELLAAWKDGSQCAAQVLVRRYMVRLTALARSRLSRKLARRIDPEDVVMSAWRSFFVGANIGRLSTARDDDLWPLLVTITLRKLARQASRHMAGRRNAKLDTTFDDSVDWQVAVSRDPSPEDAAVLVDEVESLMNRLDQVDREVLTRRLQGEEQTEIANAMNCSERTVRRSMQRIRSKLTEGGARVLPEVDTQIAREDASVRVATRIPQIELQPTHEYSDIQLQKLVGVGGFGKVYRSVDRVSGSTVAVKFLKKPFWKDQRAREQMVREFHLVSNLSHPNIAKYRGWGVTPQGAMFVVMDWINGVSADEWFQVNERSVQEAIQCGIAIANALCVAHKNGLVHGDVTPSNIMRRNDETFLLTDFGFAQLVAENVAKGLGGTPGFLAPEQVSDAFGPIGTHTDVYGLGGLIYSILTGEPPTQGNNLPEILAGVLSSKAPVAPGEMADNVPKPLNDLLLRCLQKEPRKRPQAVAEIVDELLAIQSGK